MRRCASASSESSTDSCTTGMSALGLTSVSGTKTPWSQPRSASSCGCRPLLVEGGPDGGRDFGLARRRVLERVRLGREVVVVVEQVVRLARRDGRGRSVGPVRGDEDDGARLRGGAEAEDLGHAVLEGVDDVFVARVAQDGKGA